MTRDEVESLIPFIPDDAPYLRHLPEMDLAQRKVAQRAKFISYALTDPKFGWKFINGIARSCREFPWELTGLDILVRAFHCVCHGDIESKDLLYAIALEMPDSHQLRAIVKCALCDPSKHPSDIDKWLHLPDGTARAYNDLFFNVADRRDEPAYLTSIVWPDGRLVELTDNYLQTEDRTMLMLRATLTKGIDSALQMAGLSNEGVLDGVSGTTKLESDIMTNATRIAAWGGLNQGGSLTGLTYGKAVLVAVRGAGETTMSDDELALHNINAVSPALEEIRKHNGLKGLPPPDYRDLITGARAKAAFALVDQKAALEKSRGRQLLAA